MCTEVHASATLPTASPVSRPRAGAVTSPASESVKATATRLAAPAPRSTPSAANREASSLRAIRDVACASTHQMPIQTHTTKTSAATSEAHNAATDHDAPASSATAAAAQPPTAPTITLLAASPERSGALAEAGSRATVTDLMLGAAGHASKSNR